MPLAASLERCNAQKSLAARWCRVLHVLVLILARLVSGMNLVHETPLTLLHEVPADSEEPQRVAGYFDLNSTRAGRMFYWFFESRTMQASDPLVLWVHGGPGCSSALAVFYEHGPYRIDDRGKVRLADYSWDVNHNMIYVDQPLGTGFSYSTDKRDTVYDEAALSEDMVAFLAEFLQEHPDMQMRDLYLAGVSYAGHMVPNIAVAVRDAISSAGLPLRLAGVALGNPWIVPPVQYHSFGKFAEAKGLVDKKGRNIIDSQGVPMCQAVIDTCLQVNSRDYCSRGVSVCGVNTVGVITRANPGINVYDVRKPCYGSLCYDYTALSLWLEQASVRSVLGVTGPWSGPCSTDTHSNLMGDWLLSYDHLLAQLLEEGIPVLVYAGMEDLLCNWMGQEAWLESMSWTGAQQFREAEEEEWVVNGRVAGSIRSAGLLSFVKVEDAGHEVPMDVPEAAWHLYSRFTRNVSLVDDRDMAAYMVREMTMSSTSIGLGASSSGQEEGSTDNGSSGGADDDGGGDGGEEVNLVLQPSEQRGGAPQVSVSDSLVTGEDGGGSLEPSVVVVGRRRMLS